MPMPDKAKHTPATDNADPTGRVEKIAATAKETATDLADHARDYAKVGQQQAQHATQTLTQTVQQNPLLAVGTAFGLGLAVSLVLKLNNAPRY